MTGLTTFQLIDVAVHFVPALVWAIVAQNAWRFVRTRQPHSRFFRMLPLVAAVVAFGYCNFTVFALIPQESRHDPSLAVMLLFALNDWNNFTIMCLARHMARFFPTPEGPRPGPVWLAANYGSALIMNGLVLVFLGLIHVPVLAPRFGAYAILRMAYQLIMLGLIVWRLVGIARPGVWGPGGGAWVARRVDVVVLAGALVSLSSFLVRAVMTKQTAEPLLWQPSTANLVADAIAGLAFAIPLAVRILGEVIRGVLMTVTMLGATGAIYFGARQFGASLADAAVRPLLDIAAVLSLVLVLVPGQSWLRAAIDHVVFRRSRRRREELQAFLHTLSPELGVSECCRRALPEITRVMPLRGAAILVRGGETLSHGSITYAPIARLWHSGVAAESFPTSTLVGLGLRELPSPLLDALNETDVVAVVPIASPRHHWGLLLISTSLLGATFSEEDERNLGAFADQLARVLDGAELLARVVSVERSLAHSEKLAAIGELAARVAHEIRNPVTAARSLAQQLCQEPQSPLNAEHADLIVTELDRVERQVAALLRFARREEFHFEPVNLGELARGTTDAFRSRLEAAGITLQLDAPNGVVALADREKLRQVLINLIENAMEALHDAPASRHLSIIVRGANSTAAVQVTDNGPGVPPDALPRLFEPFFSLKQKGTGLGLAIAKRTVEAHGGTIRASSVPFAGTTFSIELPAIEPPPSGPRQ